MRELLEKWAALEPEWCRVDDERASVMADVGTPLERPRFSAQYHRLGGYEADILASVIEAIEAQRTSRDRGWTWTLRSPRNDAPQHVGLVYYANKQWKAGRGDTPAEALLTAYLAALEAEGAA